MDKTQKIFDNWQFKRLRNFLGLNQIDFAEKIGSSQQVVTMIENNKRGVPTSIRENFYKTFKISYDEAIECETPEALNVALNTGSIKCDKASVPDSIVALPIHNVSAAAGAGTWLGDEPEQDVMYFDKKFLKHILKRDNFNTLHVIYAKGDSMDSGWNQPDDIKDGDLLMVDTSQLTGNNQIFVILVNNQELRVKRLSKRGDTLYITSNNSAYKEEIYRPDDSEIEVKVIGKVIWNGSKE